MEKFINSKYKYWVANTFSFTSLIKYLMLHVQHKFLIIQGLN
jgi:hypothetical protein